MKNGQTTPLATAVEKISMNLIDPFPNHPYPELAGKLESYRVNKRRAENKGGKKSAD